VRVLGHSYGGAEGSLVAEYQVVRGAWRWRADFVGWRGAVPSQAGLRVSPAGHLVFLVGRELSLDHAVSEGLFEWSVNAGDHSHPRWETCSVEIDVLLDSVVDLVAAYLASCE
jgi:hypothetical protein